MSREAVPSPATPHERASATVASSGGQDAVGASRYGSPSPWRAEEQTLRTQQEWFMAVMTTPQSEPAPTDALTCGQWIAPSSTLTPLERLDIYRRSYHARLIECLVDDYPAVQFALGEAAFEALCRGYIRNHPSRSPSLNGFGQAFAAFAREQPIESPRFVADLATLEWAIVGAIHAPQGGTLTQEALAQVPPERFAHAKLTANPSLQLLSLGYPVNGYFHAFRRGGAPPLPPRQASCVAVYRTERSVWRLPLSPHMASLVASLSAGVPLGAALAQLAPQLTHATDEAKAQQILIWFRDAVASGLFSGISAS